MPAHKPPQSIQEILQQTLKNWKVESSIKKYSIWNFWEEIVGSNVAKKAQPIRLQDSTLVVAVCSHPWMTELSLMKSVILEKIRQKIKDCPIRNLRFELVQPEFKKDRQKSR